MTPLVTELYDALVDAGASDNKARKAAQAVAIVGSGFAGSIERQLAVLNWQMGALTTVFVAVGGTALWLLGRIAAKIGVLD